MKTQIPSVLALPCRAINLELLATKLPPLVGATAQARSIVSVFQEAYRLQAEEGDLISAFEGFDRLTRARRGDPWPEFSRTSAISECAERGAGQWEGEVESCVAAFFDRNNDTVRAFTRRAGENAQAIRAGVSPPPEKWDREKKRRRPTRFRRSRRSRRQGDRLDPPSCAHRDDIGRTRARAGLHHTVHVGSGPFVARHAWIILPHCSTQGGSRSRTGRQWEPFAWFMNKSMDGSG